MVYLILSSKLQLLGHELNDRQLLIVQVCLLPPDLGEEVISIFATITIRSLQFN